MTTTLLTALALMQVGSGAAAERAAAQTTMTTGGWVFMIGAWVCIFTLVYYTFSKVIRGGRNQ